MHSRGAAQSRAERLVAGGRVVLAVTSLIAIYVDPSEPARYAALAYSLMALYSLYAIVLAWLAWRFTTVQLSYQVATHVADMLLFSAFVYLTEGHTSPFFLYFIFALFCATLRFGSRGVLWTAVAAVLLFVGLGLWAGHILQDPGYQVNRFIIRSVYLLVAATLLFYLGRHQENTTRQLLYLGGWPRTMPRTEEDVAREVFEKVTELFRVPRALLYWDCDHTPRLFVGHRDGSVVHSSEQYVDEEFRVELDDDSRAFFCLNVGSRSQALVSRGESFARVTGPLIGLEHVRRFGLRTVLGVRLEGELVRGHLLLLDRPDVTAEEIVLAEVAGRLVVATLDQYRQWELLQHGAIAKERMRFARDLHDSVLQSLTGAALQLQSLHGLVVREPDAVAGRIAEIQTIIATEQRELRQFIQELKTEELQGKLPLLADRLNGLAERYRRQWSTQVDLEIDPAVHLVDDDMKPEIYSIVNEAVSNAVRHGKARNVRGSIRARGGAVEIQIVDDGRGFPFEGEFDLAELVEMKRGPVTLKERITSLGGNLRIRSGSNGVSLNILLPVRHGGEAEWRSVS